MSRAGDPLILNATLDTLRVLIAKWLGPTDTMENVKIQIFPSSDLELFELWNPQRVEIRPGEILIYADYSFREKMLRYILEDEEEFITLSKSKQ